jgi:PTS system fructose-specific IIC component
MSLKQIWQAANPKGHLLTAISFLIPIVCGSGFIIAIGMGLGGTVQDTLTPGQFDAWQAMATLGAKALGLLPVVIAVEYLARLLANQASRQDLSSGWRRIP